MALLIRDATPADADRLTPIVREVQELHLAARPDTFKAASDEDLTRGLRSLLEAPNTRLLLAERDGELAGYLVVVVRERLPLHIVHADSWWELDQIAVRASHRRQGVGRALVERLVADARAAGVRRLELMSWTFNQGAHRAFESYGFRSKSVRFELGLAGSEPTLK
jgi:GNAT superfamily N-acetyltransferase